MFPRAKVRCFRYSYNTLDASFRIPNVWYIAVFGAKIHNFALF